MSSFEQFKQTIMIRLMQLTKLF